jgi:hypothetical protein
LRDIKNLSYSESLTIQIVEGYCTTAEEEYYAASEIAIEIIHLRNLLHNMGFPQGDDTPVYKDNTACIKWGNNIIGGREHAKHIDNRKHFSHEVIQNRHRDMRLIRDHSGYQRVISWQTSPPWRCLCRTSSDACLDSCAP